MDIYLSFGQKNFAATPLFFTIFSTVELEVGKHILSAIAMSSKSVIMTDNVVMSIIMAYFENIGF